MNLAIILTRRRRGFSLLEILIGIAILSFTITPIISIYRYTTQANVKSVYAIHAANLAGERIEHFKFGGTLPPTPGAADSTGQPPLGEYLRLKMLLQEVAAPPGTTFNELDPKWQPFEKLEDYGKIPYFPNYKRYTRIAFFPEEKPDPTQYTDNLLAPEYVMMTARIKIFVEVTWVESPEDQGNRLKEKMTTMLTIVANKN